jgi:hypothetical protein
MYVIRHDSVNSKNANGAPAGTPVVQELPLLQTNCEQLQTRKFRAALEPCWHMNIHQCRQTVNERLMYSRPHSSAEKFSLDDLGNALTERRYVSDKNRHRQLETIARLRDQHRRAVGAFGGKCLNRGSTNCLGRGSDPNFT